MPSPAMKFTVDYLTQFPGADYTTVKQAAAMQGFTMAPILYGKARTTVRAKTAPPAAPSSSSTEEPVTAARPRSAAKETVSRLISEVEKLIRERDDLIRALEEIGDAVDSVLK